MPSGVYEHKTIRVKKKCQVCEKEFYVFPYVIKNGYGKFCSFKCEGKWRNGTNSPNWKGGVSMVYKLHWAERKWKEQSQKTLKRDDYQCQLCGKRGGNLKLHAHHIIPWRVEHNDKTSNLITLCSSCHKKVEIKWYEYAPMFLEMLGVYTPSKEDGLFKGRL